MHEPKSARRWIVAGAAMLALAAAGLGIAEAAKPKLDSRVYDLRKKIAGRSGADWAVEWWQWATSIPDAVNPLNDETGEFVEIGQRGPVWFLCGTFGDGTANRTAKIPTGRALFFPVFNTYNDNVGYETPFSVRDLQGQAAEQLASLDTASLRVTVDGSEIRGVDRMRVRPKAFAITVPPDSLFDVISGGLYPPGVYSPAVTDGYWVMLRPLSKGRHTVRIQASSASTTIDVTYSLDVIEYDQPFPPPEEE